MNLNYLSNFRNFFLRIRIVIIADAEKTNLKEYRIAETGFDYIIYGDVLEHLDDPWTVIYEHKKLLKNNGYVVVSIPKNYYQRLHQDLKSVFIHDGGHLIT